MDTADGGIIFVCRRFSASHGKLSDLGFPDGISSRLLAAETKDGLVMFMGRTGSGKTTAAVAYCVEWLTKFGGVCWTVENPSEISFDGEHGKGVCYQTEVKDDKEFGYVIRRMMRASPNLIMIGEIKDESAAREAIQAATSGHLVVTTFHANDIQSGLARFAAMLGPSGTVADAMRAAIHLQLRIDNEASQKRVLLVEQLFVSGAGSEGVRPTLRAGDFHLLKSEIERQKRQIMSGGLP